MPRGRPKKDLSAKSEPNNGTTVTKWDAVKEALADLGNDAMPLAIRDHIKTKFGLDLDKNLISNYKSTLLKGGGKKKNGRKKKGRVAAAPARSAPGAGGISLDDIKAVKQLMDRMGADKLKDLAQVLGK